MGESHGHSRTLRRKAEHTLSFIFTHTLHPYSYLHTHTCPCEGSHLHLCAVTHSHQHIWSTCALSLHRALLDSHFPLWNAGGSAPRCNSQQNHPSIPMSPSIAEWRTYLFSHGSAQALLVTACFPACLRVSFTTSIGVSSNVGS